MSVLVAALAGAALGHLGWRLLHPTLAQPLFLRENHRGASVPTAGGVVLVLVALTGLAAVAVAGAIVGPGRVHILPAAALLTATAAAGYGVLGLLDDLAGSSSERGFRGHLAALREGRLTTGAVKLVGGAALGLGLAGALHGDGADVVVDGALLALAANLANLLDRAPGRTGKAAIVVFAALVVATGAPTVLGGPALVLGGALALLWPDLDERVMLGDTGANLLGGVVGLAAVLTLELPARVAVLAVLVALNAASEVVSFSRVIERVPPLRALDHLGRRG